MEKYSYKILFILICKIIRKVFILIISVGLLTSVVNAETWQPSLKTNCDPSKNISPVLEDLTVALASVPADALHEQKVTFEPSILFNDETFTLMVRNMDLVGNNSGVKIPLYVSDAARYYEVYQEDQEPQLYDDGTHGDVRANDGVYTRSCLSLPSADWSGKSFQTGHYILFLDSSFRNTETVTEIAEGVSINDTGFFISLGNEYTKNRKTKNYHSSLLKTETSKAMKAVWDAKGSIFDIISINPREQLVGGGGMYRVHDFIQGLGHKPPCPNYSYCYSFLDGLKHPELIAVIIISDLNPSPLTHEIEHAMLGINSGDDFPQGNTNPADDRKFLLTREWSVDGGHIEADSNVNTSLKGPLWDPSRGYPHAVNLKVDGELLETHFGRDADGTFRLKERTDKDFQLSEIFLYMLGVIDANEATETYYKLVNYRLNDCVPGEGSNLVCTNDLIDYDEVISFTTQDFINKFGEYSNPRSSSFDPANIKLGILNISDRKHTDAEITYKSKIFRSYAKGAGPKIQFGDEVLRGHIWSHITKGKSNVIIDFTRAPTKKIAAVESKLPDGEYNPKKNITSTIVSTEKEFKSINTEKLLSYIFTGMFQRNNSPSVSLLTPNKDQYFLKEGDHFSSEKAIIDKITSKGVIVIDKNNQEYFFEFMKKGVKLY